MDNDTDMNAHLQWLALRGRRQQTITGRGGTLARCAAILPVPMLAATESDLITWRSGLAGLADASVISAVSHVRGFYAWAERTGRIPASPAADLPVPPMPDYEPRPMSEEDLATAIECAPPRIRVWIVLGAFAGLRCIEIALLRRDCVREHDDPPHIVIRKDATKGGRKGRTVYLCEFAVAEIEDYGLPARGWSFPHLDGRPGPVSAHAVSNMANEYLHSVGIPGTMHTLRHRYGTELLDASDGDLRLVQDQMGHESPATTAKYTKVKTRRAVAAAAALPVPAELRKTGLAA